jgi:hypothetical protein
MEFQPLLDAAIPGPVNMPTEAEVAGVWPPVGPPVVLAELDLTTFEDASVQVSTDLVVDTLGAVNAVAVTFRAALHGTIAHTLDPWTWPTSSWATSVWVLPDRLDLQPGAALRVHYNRRFTDAPDGLTCEVVERAGPEPLALGRFHPLGMMPCRSPGCRVPLIVKTRPRDRRLTWE